MIIIVGLSAEAIAADDIASAPLKLSTCVPGLTARLQSLGICYVRMEYRGENCQGAFVNMEFMKVDDGAVSPLDPTVHSTVLQALFTFVLSQRHPDWTAGYGSTGDFRWNLSTDALIHTHYKRGENGNERMTHHDL